MRTIRFTIWQMLLVIVLVLSVLSTVLTALHALLPPWTTPWLLPLLALVVVDATLTQRVVMQERLSLGEQGTLRLVEVVLLTVAIRVASAPAEDVPLLELIEPWVRDPLTFFGGRFAEYLIAAIVAWVLTTLVAQSVLDLEAEPPRLTTDLLSSEESALLQDRTLALARFDRLWLICVVLSMVGAALVLRQQSIVTALQTWPTAQPLLGVLLSLLAGFLLHSQGQLDQLQYGWHLQQTNIDAEVPRRWRRAGWLLIGAALLVGVLLSGTLRLVPPPPLVPLTNFVLLVLTVLLALLVGLFSLILFPFAWLLSQLSGGTMPALPALPPIQPPQIPQGPTERPLLPALIFWLCALLLIGVAALRYVQQRQALRGLLMRWPGTRWLMRWLSTTWQEFEQWRALAVAAVQRRLRRRQAPPRRRAPRGSTAQIRALYRRLVRAAQERGVPHSRSQTAYELRAAASAALPPATDDITHLTDVYVEAEYGPALPQPTDVRRARSAWRRIERVVARTRGRLRRSVGGKR